MFQMSRERLTDPDGAEPDEGDAGSHPEPDAGSHPEIRGEDSRQSRPNANLVQEQDADDGDAGSDRGSQMRGEGRPSHNMSLAQIRGEGRLGMVNDFYTDSYSYATLWKTAWTEINDLVYFQNECGEHWSDNPPHFRGIAVGVMYGTTIKMYDCEGCACTPFFEVTGNQYGKLDSWDWYVSKDSTGKQVKSWIAIPSR